MKLQNKNIILTGAGRGIGKVIAEECAKEGANIALLSRTEVELKETFEKIKDISPGSFYLKCDIADESSILQAKKKIHKIFNNVDVLINNAGVQFPIGPFYRNALKEWKENFNINLFGTVTMTYYFLPGMIKNNKGKIINFSGGGATSPRPNFSAYAVAKTAIVRFTETLAEEMKDFNIDINAVAPGAINTNMLSEVLNAAELAGNELQEAEKRKVSGGNDPLIAAKLVCFLASDESDHISGKLISAQWDKWNDAEFCQELISNKVLATLRRIDNKTFFKKI